MSLTYSGIFVAIGGLFLVNQLGVSEPCATEFSTRIVEYAPVIMGGVLSAIGRWRLGGIKWYGARK